MLFNPIFNFIMTYKLQEQIYNELTRMRSETHNLQLSLERYKGHDLSNAKLEDLDLLEQQLESSINKVRARKVRFFFLHLFFYLDPSTYVIESIFWTSMFGRFLA